MRLRSRGQRVEIPTSSMADIAFLLIVFFMVTTVFAETMGLNFAVPQTQEDDLDTPSESEEAVHVKIATGGHATVDDVELDPARIDADLVAYLVPKLERWPEKPILVTADADAPYGLFVEVYDGIRQVERVIQEKGILPPHQGLRVSILSLKEVEALKLRFGQGIFE